MEDFSMYKFFKGEKKNPYEKTHSDAKMWWFYESRFDEDFEQNSSSDWFAFFESIGLSDKFMDLLDEEDYEKPHDKKKLFDFWLNDYFFPCKTTDYGDCWGIKSCHDTPIER